MGKVLVFKSARIMVVGVQLDEVAFVNLIEDLEPQWWLMIYALVLESSFLM
jgi:hypothetical protein